MKIHLIYDNNRSLFLSMKLKKSNLGTLHSLVFRRLLVHFPCSRLFYVHEKERPDDLFVELICNFVSAQSCIVLVFQMPCNLLLSFDLTDLREEFCGSRYM